MAINDRKELMEMRKQSLTELEQKLKETWSSEKDNLFYYHRSEGRIVLSHVLFWAMTKKMSEGRSNMTLDERWRKMSDGLM